MFGPTASLEQSYSRSPLALPNNGDIVVGGILAGSQTEAENKDVSWMQKQGDS